MALADQYQPLGGGVARSAKLSAPKDLPSGYLKHSVSPKITDICHFAQAFYAKIFLHIR